MTTEVSVWVPMVSALAGAMIGAGASIATVWIQSRTVDRRNRAKHIADLALEIHKSKRELALKLGGPFADLPLVVYLHYTDRLVKLMEQGRLTTTTLEALETENMKFVKKVIEMDDTVHADARAAIEEGLAKNRARP